MVFTSFTHSRLRATGLVAAGLASLTAVPASAGTYISTVYASDLNNPRDLAFGPDGALYIAESGFNDVVPTTGPTVVFTSTGSISQVFGGTQTRLVSGLPTIVNLARGGEVTGAQGLAFDGSGIGYVAIGLGADPANRPAGSLLGHVLTFGGDGSFSSFADVSAYEAAFNPMGGTVDSNPFHLAYGSGGLFVTDSGANTLYDISATGDVSLVAGFPDRFIGPPVPFSQSVPTGAVVAPDGTIYVAELTGFPFTQGAARIYSIAPGSSTAEIYADGFTNLTDLAVGADGALYALSFDLDGILGPETGGGIMRVSSAGVSENIFSGLANPTGLTIGGDNAFYVTTSSAGPPGSGQVLRISAVPEPATWALMLLGFGAVAAAMRGTTRRGKPVRLRA